jgi:hypothetical protein
MNDHSKIRTSATAISLTVLALAGSAPASADPMPTWEVAAGELLVVVAPLHVEAAFINVAGTILAQPDASGNGVPLVLEATERITVSGSIVGADGASFGIVDGLVASSGGDGSSIVLKAPLIELLPGTSIQPGAGGVGGSAVPTSGAEGAVVVGGDGGEGGWLAIVGDVVVWPNLGEAWLGNAMGGNGGKADASAIVGFASAYGGDGGRFGTVLTTDTTTSSNRAGPAPPADGKPVHITIQLPPAVANLLSGRGGHCPPDVPPAECILRLIEGDGVCDGADGDDANKDGRSYEGGPAGTGANGADVAGLIGLNGERGYDGDGAGLPGGRAEAGDGTDGCWAGKGGDGGDASADGGAGQKGGEGGRGGSGNLAGGIGGNGGPAGNGGYAEGGHPGCGGWLGKSGNPGTASAVGGVSEGGAGGAGGSGQLPGQHGTPGAPQLGIAGTMKTNPDCVHS